MTHLDFYLGGVLVFHLSLLAQYLSDERIRSAVSAPIAIPVSVLGAFLWPVLAPLRLALAVYINRRKGE